MSEPHGVSLTIVVLLMLAAGLGVVFASPAGALGDFYVSPHGKDTFSGSLPDPNATGTDVPFATVARAQKAVRALKAKGDSDKPIRVILRGGIYELAGPRGMIETCNDIENTRI